MKEMESTEEGLLLGCYPHKSASVRSVGDRELEFFEAVRQISFHSQCEMNDGVAASECQTRQASVLRAQKQHFVRFIPHD